MGVKKLLNIISRGGTHFSFNYRFSAQFSTVLHLKISTNDLDFFIKPLKLYLKMFIRGHKNFK